MENLSLLTVVIPAYIAVPVHLHRPSSYDSAWRDVPAPVLKSDGAGSRLADIESLCRVEQSCIGEPGHSALRAMSRRDAGRFAIVGFSPAGEGYAVF